MTLTHKEIVAGLIALNFGSGWILYGDDYDNIVWTNETIKPSIAAIKTAADTVEAVQASTRQTVLNKLGLTQDEAETLLG